MYGECVLARSVQCGKAYTGGTIFSNSLLKLTNQNDQKPHVSYIIKKSQMSDSKIIFKDEMVLTSK